MTEFPSRREVDEQDVLELLNSFAYTEAASEAGDVDRQRWSLRERTALIGSFDAAQLAAVRSAGSAPAGAASQPEFLSRDCERVTARQGRRWRLRSDVRTATLERLCTQDRLLTAALSRAGAGQDTAGDCAERLLSGDLRPLDELGLGELHAVRTVVAWFDDVPRAGAALAKHDVSLPRPAEVNRHIERVRLFQPLDALVGTTFYGRERELKLLDRYLGPDAARSTERPWLLIHGPGGMGKSTLVARYVLDHAARPGRPRGLLFTYLTLDRTDLVPEQPLTLLDEVLRQLCILVPRLEQDEIASELTEVVRATLEADSRVETEQRGTGGRGSARRDEEAIVELFSLVVDEALEASGSQVLLILDTFEQAQRKGALAPARLLDFLDRLSDACPWLRIVAAGRAPVDDRRFTHMALEGFDDATARAYLRCLLPGDGEEYELALDTVVRTVGSDPLSLKLAADLFRREGPQVLRDPSLRRQIQLMLQPEERQGVLYRRILDHLDDPDLRRIASPGLIVRRVTPDIIQHVLAEPCGLGEVDGERARILFRRLRNEATLVEETPAGDALIHRTDVRRVMLPLLRGEGRPRIDRIHHKAIAYYTELADREPNRAAEYRAEELYHRLCLGQTAKTLNARWLREAGPLLDSALEELPAPGRVYVSERLGITVEPSLLRRADDETWSRQAMRMGTRLLNDGNAEEAVSLLEARPQQVARDIPLTMLLIRALILLDRLVQARELVEPALEGASRLSDARRYAEVALTGARIEEDLGRYGSARCLLREARQAVSAAGLGKALPLSVDVAELRLFRREDRADTEEARRLREEVVRRVARLGARERERHPSLIRELAAEVGDDVPELVSQAARLVGVDVESVAGEVLETSLSDDDKRGLAEALRATRGDDSPVRLARHNSAARGAVVGDYIESTPERRPTWNHALVNAYQYEVDQAPSTRDKSSGQPGISASRPTHTWDAVVIVPGFMGSRLEEIGTGRLLWGQESTDLLTTWRKNAVQALQLTDSERAGDTARVRPIQLLRTPTWAPLFGGLEPYTRLVQRVHGCVAHPDAVLEFPYDWRLSAAHNAIRLAREAAQHLKRWQAHSVVGRSRGRRGGPPEPRLVFVAHSTGGLVVRAAMARGIAGLTRKFLCVGTPFRGVPAALGLLDPHRESNPLWRPLRQAVLTLPGFYDLLPDYRCIENFEGHLRRLDVQDVARLGGDEDLARSALRHRHLDADVARGPRIHAVVGSRQPTVQNVRFESDGRVRPLSRSVRLHNDGKPVRDRHGELSLWDAGGDGVIPFLSASSPTHSEVVVNAHYGALVGHNTVLRCVRDMLLDTPTLGIAPEIRRGSAGGVPGLQGRRPVTSLIDDGGIGLPSSSRPDEISLTLPHTLTAGRRCRIQLHGARPSARVRYSLVVDSAQSAEFVVRFAGDGESFVEVEFPEQGLYEVAAQDGRRSTRRFVLVLDPDLTAPGGSTPVGSSRPAHGRSALHYLANLRDIKFNLFEVLGREKVYGTGSFGEIDVETATVVLEELTRLSERELAASFADSDRNPPVFDTETGTARLPESFKKSYQAFMDSEYWRLGLPEEIGGTTAPPSLIWAYAELVLGANPAVWMYSSGPAFASVLFQEGTDEQKKMAALAVERRWGATMALTEPGAGSDVGAARTKAVRQDDGSWHIEGVKRFVTSGEHDLAENIVHYVLARPDGAEPGTKGLSLFMVPKFLFDAETGELVERNGVHATYIERKMGLRASTTCEMVFGRRHPAKGWLIGGKHDGVRQMWLIIEHARMTIGAKATATLSTAYLNALEYAKGRVQGSALAHFADKNGPRVNITHHPDVRRSLMTQKAYAEGMRALVLYAATVQDEVHELAARGQDPSAAERLNDLLLPIVKSYCAEKSYEQISQAFQIFGGSGYLQDYPIEQYLRDAKMDTIYESTTGVHGQDFFFRKIVRDRGKALTSLWEEIRKYLSLAVGGHELDEVRDQLAGGLKDLEFIVNAMIEDLVATEQDERIIYKVGLNTTRLLFAAGDVIVCYLLLRGAAVASEKLASASGADRSFYQGKIVAAQQFAADVMPMVGVLRKNAMNVNLSLMSLDERAF